MENLKTYLERAVSDQASDLFIVAGCPISEKLDGRIKTMEDCRLYRAIPHRFMYVFFQRPRFSFYAGSSM